MERAQDGSWYLYDFDGAIPEGRVRFGAFTLYCDPNRGLIASLLSMR